MSYAFVAIGLFALLLGGEILIRGAVGLSSRLKLSPVLIGVVIVGFGTSLPELAVGVDAVLKGSPGLALGNAIGSNIANILFILATAALITPFVRSSRALFPDGVILMVVSLGVLSLGFQGQILPWQGAVMVTILVCYMTGEAIYAHRKRKSLKLSESGDTSNVDDADAETYKSSTAKPMQLIYALPCIVLGLIGLVIGANYLIDGASQIARDYNIPEEVIGLSVLAVGTSLPELASAVMAAMRGHSGLAYGNIFGSNLFNLLGILGVSAMVGTLTFPEQVLIVDGLVMITATGVMLFFFATGKGLSRIEGALMLLTYAAYITLRYTFL